MKNSKKNYLEILQSPEWKKKRLSIMGRDNFNCQGCRSTKELQVHHKKYLPGKMPWEIPSKYLITLCKSCHNKAHEGKNISEFILKSKSKPKSKNKRTPEKVYKNLKSKDPVLQRQYDIIREKLKTKKNII